MRRPEAARELEVPEAEGGEMKAYLADYAKVKLHCTYLHEPKRGWYYRKQWIGYNVIEALEWLIAKRID